MSRIEKTHHKYFEIYNQIRADIALGIYPTGTMLPNEPTLMEMYNAGRNTVRHALKLLQEAGMIEIRQGSGSYVFANNSLSDEEDKNGKWRQVSNEYFFPESHASISRNALDTCEASSVVASKMGIAPGTKVYRVQRIYHAQDVPFSYTVQYLSTSILPNIFQVIDEDWRLYILMEKYYNLHYISGEEHISAVSADFLTANLLRIQPNSPLLLTYRIASCEMGVYEYSEIYTNPTYSGYLFKLK